MAQHRLINGNADTDLFVTVLMNLDHILLQLLPPSKPSYYSILMPMTVQSHCLMHKTFIVRML